MLKPYRQPVLLLTLILLLLLLGAAPLAVADDLVDPQQLYSYETMCQDVAELAAAYPQLIQTFSIGSSVDGRDLVAFRLGRGSYRQAVICAAMHGREYISTAFIMYMTEQYCRGYVAGSSWNGLSYRQALDEVCFYIVPMLNPDGVALAQYGLDSVSEGRRAYVAGLPILEGSSHGWAAWKSNINGVDLNRNFPHKWGLKIKADRPASWEYIGPAPGSEPETQAMLGMLQQIDYDMLVSLHSMGEVIYWLDTDTKADYDKYYPTARRFADAFGYQLMPAEDTTAAGGFLVNGERVKRGKFCMTVELGNTLYNPDFERVSSRVYGLGLLMAEQMIAQEPAPLRVLVQGVPVAFPDQQPLLSANRTLVPLRPVLEACGCQLLWDQQSQSVLIRREQTELLLLVGHPQLYINGQTVHLDVSPQLINGRVMLPLRAVGEALGYQVGWDQAQQTVSLSR